MVLIVDVGIDEAARALRDALQQHGYRVMHAASGPRAYDWLVQPDAEPCAVVLDWEALLASGCDFLSLLRRHPRLSSLPVFAWSARPPLEAHQPGSVRYVRKPGDPRIVVRVIDAVLQRFPS